MTNPVAALVRKTRIMAGIVVLTNVLGNFSLGWGMKKQAASFVPIAFLEPLFRPWVALGILLLIVWTLSRMALFSWADLSYVVPVTAVGYVLTALIGRFVLSEDVSPLRWAGTLLIVAGIALVVQTHPRTTAEPVDGAARRDGGGAR